MVQFQLLLSEAGDGVLVLNLSGELDMATVPPLRDAATTAIASGEYQTLVFDLSRLSFIDSTGLQALSEAHRGMAARGRDTRIVCSEPSILKVFELTGLDTLLSIVSERAIAVAA